MNKPTVSAALAAPLLALSFAAATPSTAEAQTIDTGKRFTMEINNPHTGTTVRVGVSCGTLDPALPNVITYAFADQFHKALSNMGNLGDFKAPTNIKTSANPLFLHMQSYHGLAPLFAKILKGQATPADIEIYKADPVGDNPVIGAKWWCEGKADKLSPTYRLSGDDIVLAR